MPNTPENRAPTVVYPGTSPDLILAYRIFGPGFDSLGALADQKKTIVKPVHQPEEHESELTPVGLDIAQDLKVDFYQVIAAYKTYKKDIKRMNKADRNLKKRKFGQLDGLEAEDDSDDSEELTDSSSSGEAGSSSNNSSNISNNNDEGEGEDENDDDDGDDEEQQQPSSPEKQETTEELLDQYLAPDLWLSKEEALARTKELQAQVEEMHAVMSKVIDIWTKELPPAKPIDQAIRKAADQIMGWRTHAHLLERMITQHDNNSKKPAAMWLSPEQKNVTYGPRVTETLFAFWELNNIMGGMQKSLAAADHVREKFLAAPTVVLKKHHYHALVFFLLRFASMSVIEEFREEFEDNLEGERQKWSPESSPDTEEYDPDYNSQDSSDSEEEEQEQEDEEEEGRETQPPTDTAAHTHE